MKVRSFAVAAAAVVTVSLAGCSTPAPQHSTAPVAIVATPTHAPSATPRPTPTPTTVATPFQDVNNTATWIISFTGVGPFTLDADWEADAAKVPDAKVYDDPMCYSANVHRGDAVMVDTWATETGATRWIIATTFSDAIPTSAKPLSPTTAEGIQVGSTLDELKTAYPQLVSTRDAYGTEAWQGPAFTIGDGDGRFIDFEVTPGGFVYSIAVSHWNSLPKEICG